MALSWASAQNLAASPWRKKFAEIQERVLQIFANPISAANFVDNPRNFAKLQILDAESDFTGGCSGTVAGHFAFVAGL